MRPSGRDPAELVFALAVVALGGLVLAGSFSIDLGAGYDRIGPRFFPYLVAAGLLGSGALLARTAWTRPARCGGAPGETRLKALGMLGVALASSVLLLERAGFVLTSTLLFFFVARAFASRRPRRDVVVGFLLSVSVYLAFTRGLGLTLPRGILAGLF